MAMQQSVRSSSLVAKLERRSNLSEAEKKVRIVLAQANDAVSESEVAAFLQRRDAPEAYGELVGKVFDALWASR